MLSACALILELGHTAQLTELGVTVENPAHHRVIGVVALDEERRFVDVDAARHDGGVHVDDVLAERGRILAHSDGMQVSQRVNAVVVGILLHPHPVFNRSKIVAESDRTAGLDRREYDLFLCGSSIFHSYLSFY